jgi:hypothetical protein
MKVKNGNNIVYGEHSTWLLTFPSAAELFFFEEGI